MKKLIQQLLKDESGASLIEYVLIGGIISIVGIGTMVLIGTDVSTIWTNIQTGTGAGNTSSTNAAAAVGGGGAGG
jgi:pilus assembly protein Flp/PilA